MPPETLLAAVMLVAGTVYMLSGGAGHGGGIWYLLANKPRVDDQRRLIIRAAPVILEFNHLWLALVVLILLVGFPDAFTTVSTVLAVPLVVLLVATLVKVVAFTVPTPYEGGGRAGVIWRRMSGLSSFVALFLIGAIIAALASGESLVNTETGEPVHGYIAPWLDVFPITLGLFTVSLGTFMAATYLAIDAEGDRLVQEDFRRKALKAAGAVAVLALFSFLFSHQGAPVIREGLGRSWWSLPFHLLTGLFAVAAIRALWYRRYRQARATAMGQVAFIVWGWALSQEPYLVVPKNTIQSSAASTPVIVALLIALGVGSVVIIPAFRYLYTIRRRGLSEGS